MHPIIRIQAVFQLQAEILEELLVFFPVVIELQRVKYCDFKGLLSETYAQINMRQPLKSFFIAPIFTMLFEFNTVKQIFPFVIRPTRRRV